MERLQVRTRVLQLRYEVNIYVHHVIADIHEHKYSFFYRKLCFCWLPRLLFGLNDVGITYLNECDST